MWEKKKRKKKTPGKKNHPKKEKNRKNALIKHQTVTPIGLLGKFISKVTVKTKQKSVKKRNEQRKQTNLKKVLGKQDTQKSNAHIDKKKRFGDIKHLHKKEPINFLKQNKKENKKKTNTNFSNHQKYTAQDGTSQKKNVSTLCSELTKNLTKKERNRKNYFGFATLVEK